MKGVYRVIVKNSQISYDFEIRRKVTIIRGNSATGKTKLANMVANFNLNGRDSGISVTSEREVINITKYSDMGTIFLHENKILIIDEDVKFINSLEFSKIVKNSSNYFVLISRSQFCNIPYSIEEIYGFKLKGKTNYFYRIYDDLIEKSKCIVDKYKKVFVEDSGSGLELFEKVLENSEVKSLGGKDGLVNNDYEYFRNSLIILDGSAIGCHSEVLSELSNKYNSDFFIPESLEFIILKALFKNNSLVEEILNNPSMFIDSSEYYSWEVFFTELLEKLTSGDKLRKYNKSKMNSFYLKGKILESIKDEIMCKNTNVNINNIIDWTG